MIIDTNLINIKNLQSDVCIIGSGPAAMSLLSVLSQSNLSINVIEGGSIENNSKNTKSNEGENIGIGNYPINKWSTDFARIRKLGGTSNVWAGWSGPLSKNDLKNKEWFSESGWDITYEELLKNYLKTNKIFNFESFEFDRKIFENFKKNKKTQEILNKKELEYNFWKLKKPPINFGKKFKNLFDNDNINLYTNLTVNEIVSDNQLKKVEYLIANNHQIKQTIIKAKIFVLCCGGLENARIILNSNKFENKGIGNQSETVGKFFMEHPHLILAETNKVNNKDFFDLFKMTKIKNLKDNLIPGIYLSYPLQEKYKLSNCASVLLEHNLLENSFAVLFRYVLALRYNPFSIFYFIKIFFKNIKNTIFFAINLIKYTLHTNKKKYYLYARLEQSPNKNSYMTLSDEIDMYGYKKIKLNWNLSALDIRTLFFNYKIISKFFSNNNIANFKLRPWIKEAYESQNIKFDEKLVYGTGHHMGTTPMSNNRSKGFVNSDLKVHSIKNLYIAGSSVFPTSGCVNPTFTIVALSLRLGEHLKNKLR